MEYEQSGKARGGGWRSENPHEQASSIEDGVAGTVLGWKSLPRQRGDAERVKPPLGGSRKSKDLDVVCVDGVLAA